MKHDLSHWFSDTQSRLAVWREWRHTLTGLNDQTLLAAVADWWKYVPLVNKSVNPWKVDTWPNPWELISSGEFCTSAQGLGIFYTLVLMGQECELLLVQIPDYKETRLVVKTPTDMLLNYVDGEVISAEKATLEVLERWRPSDLARLVKV